MPRVALLLAGLGAVGVAAGCELVVGIQDKAEATDASAADTSASTDANGDAGADVADPDLPCDKQPTNLFCDDFDSEVEAGDGWQWDLSTKGGSVGFDTTSYVSSPRSALFQIPSAPASAQLGQAIGPGLKTGYRLAFDLRLDVTEAELPSLPQVAASQVYRTSATDQLTIGYVVGPGKTSYVQVYEGAAMSPTNVTLSEFPPLQVFTRIVVVYDAAEGLTVIEDGKTIGSSAAVAYGPPGAMSIILGEVYSNPPSGSPGSAVTLELDNVVMQGE